MNSFLDIILSPTNGVPVFVAGEILAPGNTARKDSAAPLYYNTFPDKC